MARKSKFTYAQKKAYYSGMGYRAGYFNKEIPFKNGDNKQSFRDGYKNAKKAVDRYPTLKKKN